MTLSAEVAQSAERGTENPCVGGSIPSLGNPLQTPALLQGFSVIIALTPVVGRFYATI